MSLFSDESIALVAVVVLGYLIFVRVTLRRLGSLVQDLTELDEQLQQLDRLRDYFSKHPEGGTTAELTMLLDARVDGALHELMTRGELVRRREVRRYHTVDHWRLSTDQLILTLVGV